MPSWHSALIVTLHRSTWRALPPKSSFYAKDQNIFEPSLAMLSSGRLMYFEGSPRCQWPSASLYRSCPGDTQRRGELSRQVEILLKRRTQPFDIGLSSVPDRRLASLPPELQRRSEPRFEIARAAIRLVFLTGGPSGASSPYPLNVPNPPSNPQNSEPPLHRQSSRCAARNFHPNRRAGCGVESPLEPERTLECCRSLSVWHHAINTFGPYFRGSQTTDSNGSRVADRNRSKT